MRAHLILILALCGCTNEANHIGNPLLWPAYGIGNAVENSIYNERRGRVEIAVKTSFDQIIEDIQAAGGPALTAAMDEALIPEVDRPARALQLQGDLPLYAGNPGALIVALMVYGP